MNNERNGTREGDFIFVKINFKLKEFLGIETQSEFLKFLNHCQKFSFKTFFYHFVIIHVHN